MASSFMDDDELITICAFYDELVEGKVESEKEKSIHQSDYTDSANTSTAADFSIVKLSPENKNVPTKLENVEEEEDEEEDGDGNGDDDDDDDDDSDVGEEEKNHADPQSKITCIALTIESQELYSIQTINKIRSVCSGEILKLFETQFEEVIHNVCKRISKTSMSGFANILAEAYKSNIRFLNKITNENIVATVEIVLKAAAVYYLTLQSLNIHDDIDSVEELLQEYSGYELFTPSNIDAVEGEYLLTFRNYMKKALRFVPAKKNKATLLHVCALLEGSKRRYKKGGTQNASTTRRELIYEHETGFKKKSRAKRVISSKLLDRVDMTEKMKCSCGAVIFKHKLLKHMQQKKHKKLLMKAAAAAAVPQDPPKLPVSPHKPHSKPPPLPLLSISSVPAHTDQAFCHAQYVPVHMSQPPMMSMPRDGRAPTMMSLLPWGYPPQMPAQMPGMPRPPVSQMQFLPMRSVPYMMMPPSAPPQSVAAASSSSFLLPRHPSFFSSSSSASDHLQPLFLSRMLNRDKK